ncbi:MAG: argininosuccinate lyase [Candidatus Latescibacterota bacterium]|nr:argininosuccinate lyase [Candidatus Latescibacterota bacterium]
MSGAPWGGRFQEAPDALMERFNASIGFDRKLLEVDIAGSIAYARALQRAGVLNAEEVGQIEAGLAKVRQEFSAPDCALPDALEDIHMAVEQRLTELVGPVGGKLHTGRSRNDQVNLDERLYLRAAIAALKGRVRHLQGVLLASAERHRDAVLPGYTHLQQAQPVLFAHYALALFWMLERDWGRLSDAWRRADFLPLGSGALAGSTFPIDRDFLARELGFSQVTPNSLDAVSDRDFLLETLAALAILMMHLSRFCEDLIVWSSAEFGFVELSDHFSTGSSMMPQKKNPDSLELVRGKTGRVYGSLVALLTTMKAVPLTYSKDMQEDKEPLFDALETVDICLEVFAGAWESMEVHAERMEASIDSMALATDLADYLVHKGVPFREAHRIIGKLVRTALAADRALTAFELADLRAHSADFGADALVLLDVRHSLELRNIAGGTGPQAVAEQMEKARRVLAED